MRTNDKQTKSADGYEKEKRKKAKAIKITKITGKSDGN